ncbi:MAG TPA: two-component regulator propeller domain-containing protein, partial [Bacteroidales bacterium]|nr:two-component regulator propeller domain-containing protein [Bacteroidales bacterium]
NSIVEDELGNLWVGTNDKLYYYNSKSGKFSVFSPENIGGIGIKDNGFISSSYIRVVYIDHKKNVWIGTNQGLDLFVKENQTFINYYYNQNDPGSLGDNEVNAITEDHEGRLWIGHHRGLDLFQNPGNLEEKARFKHYMNEEKNASSINAGAVNHIIEYQNGLWVGVDNGGVNILQLKPGMIPENKFVRYNYNSGELNGLSSNSIQFFCTDRQNNMWVGTYGNGVSMHSASSNDFDVYRHDIYNNKSISSNQVNAFLEDNDYVWIGTEKGLNRYNKKDNTFKSYTYNPNNKNGISSNAVWALHKDSQGALWIGTWAGGLNKFDSKTEVFTRYQNKPNDTTSIGSNNIFSIFEDKDGYLWLGTMGGGLNRFDKKTGRCIRYHYTNSKINNNFVEQVVEDKSGNLWLANLSLTRFDRKTKQFTSYLHNESDSTSISGSTVYTIFCDSKSNIWIGTNGGLNLYLPKKDKFRSYQIENGLPDNAIKSISEDNFGNLWLGTNKGLSKLIGAIHLLKKPTFKNYSREDGLSSNEFNRRSCLRSSDGQMYFGSENGFIVFNPATMRENIYVPDIVFTDLLLFNKPVTASDENSPISENMADAKTITLSYGQSYFIIKFVALNYVIPRKNQYAYMMEGFDKDWNYVGTKREATYTNLPAGKYTFRVIACNNDGKWNEEGISIKVIVNPPWWSSWWFRTIIILCILAALTLGLIRLIKHIRALANQTILNERNQLKTLVNNIPHCIIIKDMNLRHIVLNNATVEYLGGQSESEYIHKTDYDLYPKELADFLYAQEKQVLMTGKPIINEESTKQNKGRIEAFSITKSPIINIKGETIGLVCIMRDITYQKKAEQKMIRQSEDLIKYNKVLNESNVLLEERQQQIEEQAAELMAQNDLLEEKQKYIQAQSSELEKSNERLKVLNDTKDRFFSIIAHDLRNPFHAVKGLSEVLLMNFDKIAPEKAKKYIDLIHSSSATGSSLLENLLTWSRSQTGTIAFEPETIDLYELSKQTFNLLDTEAKRKNIQLKQSIEPQTYLFADTNMLLTIFRNLVFNAIKFTPEGGSVTVSCVQDPQQFIISVKDTGVGISKENQEKLFNINTNFSTAGTHNEQGTGLGLILCKEFVERHGGRIWVESDKGKGCEFKFSLPVVIG